MKRIEIGTNAGIIWNLLSENGKMTLRGIGERTNYKDNVIHHALGWLARENKISIFEENDTVYIELNEVFTETYYY